MNNTSPCCEVPIIYAPWGRVHSHLVFGGLSSALATAGCEQTSRVIKFRILIRKHNSHTLYILAAVSFSCWKRVMAHCLASDTRITTASSHGRYRWTRVSEIWARILRRSRRNQRALAEWLENLALRLEAVMGQLQLRRARLTCYVERRPTAASGTRS